MDTADGVAALTHLWWDETSDDDPLAEDAQALHTGRAGILEVAKIIVPGHGSSFAVGPSTPR